MMNPKAPLWMPYGSVRAILALMLSVVFCIGFLQGTIPSDAFVPVVVAVASFYFGAKSATNPNEVKP
jgi:hypothetical protein